MASRENEQDFKNHIQKVIDDSKDRIKRIAGNEVLDPANLSGDLVLSTLIERVRSNEELCQSYLEELKRIKEVIKKMMELHEERMASHPPGLVQAGVSNGGSPIRQDMTRRIHEFAEDIYTIEQGIWKVRGIDEIYDPETVRKISEGICQMCKEMKKDCQHTFPMIFNNGKSRKVHKLSVYPLSNPSLFIYEKSKEVKFKTDRKKFKKFFDFFRNDGDLLFHSFPINEFYFMFNKNHEFHEVYNDKQLIVLAPQKRLLMCFYFPASESFWELEKAGKQCLDTLKMLYASFLTISDNKDCFRPIPVVLCIQEDCARFAKHLLASNAIYLSESKLNLFFMKTLKKFTQGENFTPEDLKQSIGRIAHTMQYFVENSVADDWVFESGFFH